MELEHRPGAKWTRPFTELRVGIDLPQQAAGKTIPGHAPDLWKSYGTSIAG